MEQNLQTYLEKMQKRMTSSDPLKRMKCVNDIVTHMQENENCIVEGMECIITLLKDENSAVRLETLKATEMIIAAVVKKLEKDREFLVRYQGNMVPLRKLLFYQAIQRTRDPDSDVRLLAVSIAGEKSVEYPSISKKATPFLMARIKDENKDVRNQAIQYIIRISYISPDITSPYLTKLFTEKKRNTDVYIAYILDKVMVKHPMPDFVQLLFDKLEDADINTEKYLISAIVKCGIHDINNMKENLITGLTDHADINWWIPARNMLIILRRIAENNPESTIPYLRYVLPLLSSKNREIRRVSVETVGSMGVDDPNSVKEALPTLVDLTRDPDEKVKDAAISALRSIGIPENEYESVREAADVLNRCRLKIIEIKQQGDLTDKIRHHYVTARNAFSIGNYEKSLKHSMEAIVQAKTREQLRIHAQEVIQSADHMVASSLLQGETLSEITTLVNNAKKAFEDRKYFLANELIVRSKMIDVLGSSAFTRTESYAREKKYDHAKDFMVCHRCGELISKGNTNCPSCAFSLHETICHKCGAEVPQGFQFCLKCDEHLDHVCEFCGAINTPEDTECQTCGGGLSCMQETEEDLELDVDIIPADPDKIHPKE